MTPEEHDKLKELIEDYGLDQFMAGRREDPDCDSDEERAALIAYIAGLLEEKDVEIAALRPPAPIPYPIDTPCTWGKYEVVVTDVYGDEREIKWFDHGEGEYRWYDVPVSALSPRLP